MASKKHETRYVRIKLDFVICYDEPIGSLRWKGEKTPDPAEIAAHGVTKSGFKPDGIMPGASMSIGLHYPPKMRAHPQWKEIAHDLVHTWKFSERLVEKIGDEPWTWGPIKQADRAEVLDLAGRKAAQFRLEEMAAERVATRPKGPTKSAASAKPKRAAR